MPSTTELLALLRARSGTAAEFRIEAFVSAIDAHDQASLNVSAKHTDDKSIHMEVVTLQGLISGMNPVPLVENNNEAENTKQFYAALEFAQGFLRRFILRKISKLLAYRYAASKVTTDPVLVLDHYCDWHEAVRDANKDRAVPIKYVIYPSMNGRGFAIQAVKKGGGQSTTDNLLVPFPDAWAGISEASVLSKVSGVESAIFCHRDRFVASSSTLAGAIEMANKSIKIYDAKSKSTKDRSAQH